VVFQNALEEGSSFLCFQTLSLLFWKEASTSRCGHDYRWG